MRNEKSLGGFFPLSALLGRMRLLEIDHSPDGWPAVRMSDISALCDEIEHLREQLECRVPRVMVLPRPPDAIDCPKCGIARHPVFQSQSACKDVSCPPLPNAD